MDRRQYDSMTEKEFNGRKVRLLRKVETKGGLIAPEGTVLTIIRKFGGFNLEMPKCSHCGVRFIVFGVAFNTVELLPREGE